MQVVNDFNSNWNNIEIVNFQFIHPSIYVNGVPPMFNEPHVLFPFPSCLSFLTIWGFCSLGKWLLAFFLSRVEFPCIYLHTINQQSLKNKIKFYKCFNFIWLEHLLECVLWKILFQSNSHGLFQTIFYFVWWGRWFGNHP